MQNSVATLNPLRNSKVMEGVGMLYMHIVHLVDRANLPVRQMRPLAKRLARIEAGLNNGFNQSIWRQCVMLHKGIRGVVNHNLPC